MNLKELFRNYGGVVVFYLVLALGAYLIGIRLNHINYNNNANNSSYNLNR